MHQKVSGEIFHMSKRHKSVSQSASVFWNDLISVEDGNNKTKFDLLS